MQKIINYENLESFTYSNDKQIKGEIKGIVLRFTGLGTALMFDHSGEMLELAERGIICVSPYYNPWCWMNKQTVNFVDEIVDVLCEKYNLNANSVKIVATGGSMGGLSALVYCVYAKITPCACVVNCPVCDLPYHFTERKDLPRTLYSAFGSYEGSFEDALKSASPLHLVDKLPNIDYTIFQCELDKAVSPEIHAKIFVREMQKNHKITYHSVPLRGHGDLSPEMRVKYDNAVIAPFLK